jgi:hypothetical protein
MNIEQKELINIIREELAEALGMDASYDRQNLTMKLRDFLDEYTGDDLQAAMDALNAVRAMLQAEMKENEDLNEDFFSDSAEEESAEADEEAAETAASASYVTGQGSGVKSERKYFKIK